MKSSFPTRLNYHIIKYVMSFIHVLFYFPKTILKMSILFHVFLTPWEFSQSGRYNIPAFVIGTFNPSTLYLFCQINPFLMEMK